MVGRLWHNARPHPGSLRLKDAIDGKRVELLDGNQWSVVPARRYENHRPVCALPCVMTLNSERRWVPGKVAKRFRRYWELSNLAAPLFWEFEGDRERANEIAFDAVVAAIAMSYRVTDVEIDLLEILDEGAAAESCMQRLISKVGSNSQKI